MEVPDFEQKRATHIGNVVETRISQLEIFINKSL
jgi:hypothetical protein